MMSSLSPVESLLPSEAVVERVANREGVDPLALTPLYEAIDPDALDAIVRGGGAGDSAVRVEFTYCGYELIVTGDGVVHIDEEAVPLATDV